MEEQNTTINKSKFKNPFGSLFNKNYSSYSTNGNFSSRRKLNFNMSKFSFKQKELVIIGFVTFVAIVLAILAWAFVTKPKTSTQSNVQKIDIQPARVTQNLNRDFAFPLKDDKGQEISKIKMVLENAELRDEIVVKGQRATAVKGRTFLIVNMKIKNDHTQTVQINTRDYIRLIVNNDQDNPLAPDIHNDPVEVQAISTKPTRVGFAINDTDKNLKLKIGEITSDKQTIDLHL